MNRILFALAILALLGCKVRAPTAPSPSTGLDPTPYGVAVSAQGAATTMEAWRPAWWIDKPVQSQNGATAAAMGTDKDLVAARRKAIEAAGRALAELLGPGPTQAGAPAPEKADTIRLADGQYRTFVLVTIPADPAPSPPHGS